MMLLGWSDRTSWAQTGAALVPSPGLSGRAAALPAALPAVPAVAAVPVTGHYPLQPLPRETNPQKQTEVSTRPELSSENSIERGGISDRYSCNGQRQLRGRSTAPGGRLHTSLLRMVQDSERTRDPEMMTRADEPEIDPRRKDPPRPATRSILWPSLKAGGRVF